MEELILAGIASEHREALRSLARTVFGPALGEVGQMFGDVARGFRARNLANISAKTDKALAAKGLSPSQARPIKLSVGLPLLEKASYQDDDVLQEMWANLIAAAVDGERDGPDGGFSLDVTFVEILHQLSRADCEVLKYVVNNGASGIVGDGTVKMETVPMSEIRSLHTLAFVSVEKLVSLGCLSTLIGAAGGEREGIPLDSPYGIMPTLLGLRLYPAASGVTPPGLKGHRMV